MRTRSCVLRACRATAEPSGQMILHSDFFILHSPAGIRSLTANRLLSPQVAFVCGISAVLLGFCGTCGKTGGWGRTRASCHSRQLSAENRLAEAQVTWAYIAHSMEPNFELAVHIECANNRPVTGLATDNRQLTTGNWQLLLVVPQCDDRVHAGGAPGRMGAGG
jgi:hypothetical protein